MGKGRKPKPPALRIVEGNPGHRPIPVVPEPGPGVPNPPTTLCREARAEWRRVVDYLAEAGLCVVDRAALSTYCELWAEVQETRRLLRQEGRSYVSDNGNLRQNPLVPIHQTALAQMRYYMGELGLTPAARVKLGGMPDSGHDAMSDYLGKVEELRRKRG